LKGYKVFLNDWTCNGFQYEVGKTYELEGEIEICSRGFHFCENLKECFNYYDCVPWNKIAEVEALGEIKKSADDSKCVTNKIKIIREIPFEDLKGIMRGNGVNLANGVNRSYSVNNSHGVNRSNGVNESDGVNISNGVNWTNGVNNSDGVNWANGVNNSDGVNRSSEINRSYGVNGSNGVNRSDGVNWSHGVNRSAGVNGSYGVLNSFGVDSALFLANKPRVYSIFNKEVAEERFEEVRDKLFTLLQGWQPTFNNLKSLYLKNGSEWAKTPIPNAEEISKKEAWADMPKQAIEYIRSLPEFDAEMFFEITGIKEENKC